MGSLMHYARGKIHCGRSPRASQEALIWSGYHRDTSRIVLGYTHKPLCIVETLYVDSHKIWKHDSKQTITLHSSHSHVKNCGESPLCLPLLSNRQTSRIVLPVTPVTFNPADNLIMGRLATAVAAAGVDADNLPEQLPNISLLDVLLPSSWSKVKKDNEDKVRSAIAALRAFT